MIKKILTLVFLISIVLAQRGGGGGGGRGGRGRGGGKGWGGTLASKRRGDAPPQSGCSKEQCPVLGAACWAKCLKDFEKDKMVQNLCLQQCTDDYGYQPFNWLLCIYALGIFFLVKCGWKYVKLPAWNLDRSFIEEHQKRTELYECSPRDIQGRFEELTSKYMSIKFIQEGHGVTSDDFKICGKKHKEIKFLYDIRIESRDCYGKWEGKGFMSFSGDGVKIWFTKAYSNKDAAGQTGLWSTLIYEGEYDGQTRFTGHWHFHGFSKSDRYSGEWIACPAKSK